MPYKASGSAHVDLMGGQIQVMFDNIVALMPHFKSGMLRPLAVETAVRQAPEHAGSYEDEVALLVVHGVLHVLGMDHADPEEAATMQARERDLLDRFHHRR